MIEIREKVMHAAQPGVDTARLFFVLFLRYVPQEALTLSLREFYFTPDTFFLVFTNPGNLSVFLSFFFSELDFFTFSRS